MFELENSDPPITIAGHDGVHEDRLAAKRLDVIKLARVHARVSDHPIRAAIWIRQAEDDLQLVEVLSSFPNDVAAHEPVACGTTEEIPRRVYLTVGNSESLRASMSHRSDFRNWIAAGEVVYQDGDEGDLLVRLARGKLA